MEMSVYLTDTDQNDTSQTHSNADLEIHGVP